MSYATQTDLNNRFGSANIVKWSDLAGAGMADSGRVAASLTYADAIINTHLNAGPYALPLQFLDAGTAIIAAEWAAVLAGCWLYFSRGLVDDPQADRMKGLKDGVQDEISKVRTGTIRLNAIRRWAPNPTAPSSL